MNEIEKKFLSDIVAHCFDIPNVTHVHLSKARPEDGSECFWLAFLICDGQFSVRLKVPRDEVNLAVYDVAAVYLQKLRDEVHKLKRSKQGF